MAGGRRAASVLVLGAQGALGSAVVRAFAEAGWRVRRGGRRPDPAPDFVYFDLDRPETLSGAVSRADVVVNTVPHAALAPEALVRETGGVAINISALPGRASRAIRDDARPARGTVVMNAGMAPGITNVVAADLLAAHGDADEVEIGFTVSTKGTSGRAGALFAHRNLTTVRRHRTALLPLPAPYGDHRCLEFAEPERGWLGSVAAGRRVRCYLCVAERGPHRALLAVNRTGAMTRLPQAAFGAGSRAASNELSNEPVAHWVAVCRGGVRVAARTIEGRGDYRCTAAVALVLAEVMLTRAASGTLPTGVFDPEDVFSLQELEPRLRELDIAIVRQPTQSEGQRARPRGSAAPPHVETQP